MTDERYVFFADLKQRKNVAASAFKRKIGTKSKKCTLPYESLSYYKRKKLNGRVVNYHMNKQLAFEEFEQMPLDLQKEYWDGLFLKAGVEQHVSFDSFKQMTPETRKKNYQTMIGKYAAAKAQASVDAGFQMDIRHTWEEFKGVSPRLKGEYIKMLQQEYKARGTQIADMFGIAYCTLKRYLDTDGVSMDQSLRGAQPREEAKKWAYFLNGKMAKELKGMSEKPDTEPSPKTVEAVPTQEKQAEPLQEPVKEETKTPESAMAMDEFSMVLHGPVDAERIAFVLRSVAGMDSVGTIRITWQKDEQEIA
jgi:hypothetical protein